MANTYIILSVSTVGDKNTVTGSVNNVPVTVYFWTTTQSLAAMASAIAFRNFIVPLMLEQLPAAPSVNTILPQTFTQ
jgi:hypothetical protein